MKKVKIITIILIIGFVISGCDQEYIDPITPVDPGEDTESPDVEIESPNPLVTVPFTEEEASVTLEFTVSDDIELQTVNVSLDGDEIASYSEFIDYRMFMETIQSGVLPIGEHVLEVTATDINGKTTREVYDFEITNEYLPLDGEVFYMPFEGESYIDLISGNTATEYGEVSFVEGVEFDAARFNGSQESYLLFEPSNAITGAPEFSISFWSNVEFVDQDDDGEIDGVIGLVNLSNITNFWGNIDIFIENGSGLEEGADMRIHVTNDDSETWITSTNDVQGVFDNWAHHVITYSNADKEFKYFINGDQVLTTEASWEDDLNFTNAGPMVMGTVQFQTDPSLTSAADNQSWAGYLTGELDEIKIFNRAIGQVEVDDLYENAL